MAEEESDLAFEGWFKYFQSRLRIEMATAFRDRPVPFLEQYPPGTTKEKWIEASLSWILPEWREGSRFKLVLASGKENVFLSEIPLLDPRSTSDASIAAFMSARAILLDFEMLRAKEAEIDALGPMVEEIKSFADRLREWAIEDGPVSVREIMEKFHDRVTYAHEVGVIPDMGKGSPECTGCGVLASQRSPEELWLLMPHGFFCVSCKVEKSKPEEHKATQDALAKVRDGIDSIKALGTKIKWYAEFLAEVEAYFRDVGKVELLIPYKHSIAPLESEMGNQGHQLTLRFSIPDEPPLLERGVNAQIDDVHEEAVAFAKDLLPALEARASRYSKLRQSLKASQDRKGCMLVLVVLLAGACLLLASLV